MAAIDGDFAAAIGNDLIKSGGGGGLRVGLQRDLSSVLLIPEMMFQYHVLDANTRDNAALSMIVVGGRGRIRILNMIQPGLFVHIGAGRLAGDSSYAATDLAFDVGATVDVAVHPLIDLGLHAALNRMFGGPNGALTFATVGLHAALVIEDKL